MPACSLRCTGGAVSLLEDEKEFNLGSAQQKLALDSRQNKCNCTLSQANMLLSGVSAFPVTDGAMGQCMVNGLNN